MPTTTARNVTDIVAGALTRTPGATAAELAEVCGLGRSTVAKRLAALERAGQARREPGDDIGLRRPDRWTAVAEPDIEEQAGSPDAGRPGAGGRLARGELRQLVLDQVAASPAPVGAGVVAAALGRSSGAVGNALEHLAASGVVARTSTSPRRYGPLPDAGQQGANQLT